MNTLRLWTFATAILVLMVRASFCQPQKIAILPFNSIGIDSVSAKTAEMLLRTEIGKLSSMDMVSEKRTEEAIKGFACAELGCAIEIGQKLDADEVVFCKLASLGEKVIVYFSLINVSAQNAVLSENITAFNLEDLEDVMKRVAMSVVHRQSIEKSVQIGVITEKETLTPHRRKARRLGGFSFGYLFPQQGYDSVHRSFTIDFRTGVEFDNYCAGLQTGFRKGFFVNLFSSYLFSKKDFCPYAGGAVGFHWVSHQNRSVYYYNDYGQYSTMEEKKGDGLELIANAGLIAFRTFDFQLMVNLAYAITLNDFNDRAVVFTIGVN